MCDCLVLPKLDKVLQLYMPGNPYVAGLTILKCNWCRENFNISLLNPKWVAKIPRPCFPLLQGKQVWDKTSGIVTLLTAVFGLNTCMYEQVHEFWAVTPGMAKEKQFVKMFGMINPNKSCQSYHNSYCLHLAISSCSAGMSKFWNPSVNNYWGLLLNMHTFYMLNNMQPSSILVWNLVLIHIPNIGLTP